MAETTYILTEETSNAEGVNNFSPQDLGLVDQFIINSEFNSPTDVIELAIYAEDNTLLELIPSYTGYKQLGNSASAGKEGTSVLYIDPIQDSQTLGYNQGGVFLLYNFLRNISDVNLFISEISPDRTEIKAKTLEEVPELLLAIAELQRELSTSTYFYDFRLNFLNGTLLIGININVDSSRNITIKLYEPLPAGITTKVNFRLVEIVSDSVNYSIEAVTALEEEVFPILRGPNFTSELDGQTAQPTEFLDYNQLYLFPVTSSYYKLINQVSQSGVEINIDYTDYSNFVHFSSAQERLNNFAHKLELIQTYNSASNAIVVQLNTTASLASSTSVTFYENLVKGILEKFDGYDNYLFFESSSFAWPKSGTVQPYTNLLSEDSVAVDWYNSQILSASLYDESNLNGLIYTVPEFIRQDSSNAPYSLFLNMLGQHFDSLWIYARAVTDKYNADNRIDYGISKDLIGEVLKSFGVKLYSSNFSIANLSSLFLGEFYDSGSEQITSFVTASNQPTPDRDLLAETYKRIYHNLPYLIKTKGTERGLRALINCFGIPSGSLEIKSFGGVDRTALPYFGAVTGSVDKIRLDNTGSIVPGDTLSKYASIQNLDQQYTHDQHIIEVGFSPSYYIDQYIHNNITASFNIDQYIGDPRTAQDSSYKALEPFLSSSLGGLDRYDIFDFVRLIKFYDNQIFKMIKDFVPARDSTTAGIIIKPHVLDRSKVKQPLMSFTQPEYTGSIESAFITGSNGGVLADYSTAHSQSLRTPVGPLTKIFNANEETINGELGGSDLRLYTGSLNINNPFKKLQQPLLTFDIINTTDPTALQGSIPAGDIFIFTQGNFFLEEGLQTLGL